MFLLCGLLGQLKEQGNLGFLLPLQLPSTSDDNRQLTIERIPPPRCQITERVWSLSHSFDLGEQIVTSISF
jgi:hypothetical protein